MVSRLPDKEADPIDEEMSGSNLSRAYSRNDASHSGVNFAICGLRTSIKYVCSALAIWSSAHAENTDIFTMTAAFELSPLKSPMAAVSVAPIRSQSILWGGPRHCNLLEKFSSAEIRSLSIRPIRSTSVTIPVAMKVAHTLIASAASSGDESAANAGVSAEPICAWYCSSKVASAKSGSGVLPNSY